MIPEKFSTFCRDQSMALLFCYFNQLDYFHEYLKSYEGKCIILIGPVGDYYDIKTNHDIVTVLVKEFKNEEYLI